MNVYLIVILAIIPPLVLMWRIYAIDTVDKEPIKLVAQVFGLGCLSVIPAIILEMVVGAGIAMVLPAGTIIYLLVENFLGVAIIEELCKGGMCYLRMWKHKEFNYRFDGVVYCVASALGFAAVENIEYGLSYGLETVVVRAITSIPGHMIFGIFMGMFLGQAKCCKYDGDKKGLKRNMALALVVPTLIHGFYDFILSIEVDWASAVFLVFLLALNVVAIIQTKRSAVKYNRPIFTGYAPVAATPQTSMALAPQVTQPVNFGGATFYQPMTPQIQDATGSIRPIRALPVKKFCGSCGRPVVPGRAYCGGCGKKL